MSDSTGKRIAKCFLSAAVASIFGVVVAEVVANCLVEISETPVFAIIFGVAFFALGAALLYRIIRSSCDKDEEEITSPTKRFFMLAFTALVFATGAFSILLENNWVQINWVAKIPMYATVGLVLAFALSFCFTEILTMGLCNKCCKTDFEEKPIIGSSKQLAMVFIATLVLGTIHGVLFGVIDVENDDAQHDKFFKNVIISLPIGAILGAIVGFWNQWIRSSAEVDVTPDQRARLINSQESVEHDEFI
eukprot:TRINITY_DN1053_c0_g1_i1.p1 TRINITY_DN1053_c0_g1~~TRINITY_DN1053_c0_g1_i1.p1  ORF type:complete len:248 (-),score=36.54 TRINITY_DN1053_c0_g1_i1:97-840(-)